MPDALFENPRLAETYDPLDPDRIDLDAYAAIAEEFGARRVLDVGCGTGTFACLMAQRGIDVVGVDPAAASLDVARRKTGAATVRWIHGDAVGLPPLGCDLATMTANVAQVFLTDGELDETLRGIHGALRPGGYLAFEVRDPARQAWRNWNREETHETVDIPGIGSVETWCDLTAVDRDRVSFRWTTVFAADHETIVSDSTLRFRTRAEVERSLDCADFDVIDVRDAQDRPGREFVFVARARADKSDAEVGAGA